MRSRSLTLFALAAALAVPAASRAAGPAFTPPAPPGVTDVGCVVQNLSSRAAVVHAILREDGGTLLEESPMTVPPGETHIVVSTPDDIAATLAHCEFFGLGKGVRGYLMVPNLLMLEASR